MGRRDLDALPFQFVAYLIICTKYSSTVGVGLAGWVQLAYNVNSVPLEWEIIYLATCWLSYRLTKYAQVTRCLNLDPSLVRPWTGS